MSLRAHVVVRRDSLRVDVVLEVAAGETVAGVGANGAGKTTLLLALAGLVPGLQGRVEVDGATWEDSATGVVVPPHRRSVGFIFQDLRLFPGMSVRDNVAFGMRSRGVATREANRRAAEWLARVGLGGRGDSRPGALSGGEAQRVALARALAVRPRLLLLDEPTASADVAARADLRALVVDELAGYEGTRLLVTHDVDEASAVADRVVVIEHGRAVDDGTLTNPGTRAASTFIDGGGTACQHRAQWPARDDV